MIKRRENAFFSEESFEYTFPKRKINVLKNWLRDHLSWAPCGIGIKIESILKSFFLLILLHQCRLSLLYSRIQDYMLSLMNEVNPCAAFVVGFVWEAKPAFSTQGPLL